jgi:transcriptional regulator with GAF, ATPase, and Fis domain
MATKRTQPGAKTTRSLDRAAGPRGARGHVVVVRRGHGFESIAVDRREIVIGRAADCDIVIEDDALSRRHARLTFDAEITIADLGSRNGTFVGGRRVGRGERVVVAVGDLIEVATTALFVQPAPPRRADDEPASPRPGVVVRAPSMKQLYAIVDIVAPSPLRVLLLGETGVGKEVVARTIHERSRRARRPFLAINCGALPETTLEAELFGYEKGAFTGAVQAKPGLFEAAHGGTLFLDEIGELAPSTQAALLRVLESGEVLRLGSVAPRTVDVRIVAATNRDLQARIRDGQFRSDLYFRLDGAALTVPPLRERPEDIAPLAEMFAAAIAKQARVSTPTIDTDAMSALEGHAWPGNVRELRNAIERAVVLRQGKTIRRADLQLGEAAAAAPDGGGLWSALEHVERARIAAALDAAGGNQSAAARALGIARVTLIKRMAKYGLGKRKPG